MFVKTGATGMTTIVLRYLNWLLCNRYNIGNTHLTPETRKKNVIPKEIIISNHRVPENEACVFFFVFCFLGGEGGNAGVFIFGIQN